MDPLSHLDQAFADLPTAPRWWVALSGGVDSLTLLHRLVAWSAQNACPPLAAVHVNHGIAEGALEWSTLCKTHCDQLNVPLTIVKTDPLNAEDANLEALAREARYGVFEALLAPGEVLLQGHHLDDQAETVLFRLLRGAGPLGLSGIPSRRSLGEGIVARPMLTTPRAEIAAWASEQGWDFVDDPANADRRFDRNYLRHEVLPLIEARWPGYRKPLARAASLQRAAVEMAQFDADAEDISHLGEPMLEVGAAATVTALAARLHRWLVVHGERAPDQSRLSEFARQVLTASADRLPRLELAERELRGWRGAIYLVSVAARQAPETSGIVVGTPRAGGFGQLHWRQAEPGLPSGLKLAAQRRTEGLVVTPLGRPSRPLSQWFQECGIPPWWRDHVPLLHAEGGELVAVPGCGLTASAKSLISDKKPGWMPDWRPPSAAAELSR